MRNKGWRYFCVALLLAVVLTVPASANSAQTWWEGVDGSGVIVTDGTSPIVVEKEILTFDLQEFPKEYYDTPEAISQYQGAVTAEYTFYNPAEYTVTAKLLFPFGILPSYAGFPGDTMAECYGVRVDGAAVETTLRHSLSNGYDQFSLETDLGRLSDDYLEGEWVQQDTPVRKYIFQVEGTGVQAGDSVTAALLLDAEEGRWLYAPDIAEFSRKDDGMLEVSSWVWDEKTLEVYVIGQDFDQFPVWEFYSDGNMTESVGGDMREVSVEELTFQEFALSQWTADSGVSEMDWYNAMVIACEEMATNNSSLISFWDYGMDLQEYLMGWYEYEITLEPGQQITNTLTAPMYPDIDQDYEPAVYTYHYLLSPAQTWSQFGTLEIRINTPYYISEESLSGFEKTETGYELVQEGLPEGELTFFLCQEEMPQQTAHSGMSQVGPEVIMILFVGVLLCGVVWLLIGKLRKKH